MSLKTILRAIHKQCVGTGVFKDGKVDPQKLDNLLAPKGETNIKCRGGQTCKYKIPGTGKIRWKCTYTCHCDYQLTKDGRQLPLYPEKETK